MKHRTVGVLLSISICLAAFATGAQSASTQAPATIGFGVSVPYEWPIDWDASFSYLSLEALLSPHLTAYFDAGVYPSSFPDLLEGSASLLVKGWVGPTALFGGGGLTLQGRHVGSAWSLRPMLNLRAGYQIWLVDSLAVQVQFRTLEPLPLEWVFSPEIAVGFCIGLGRARPEAPRLELDVLWLLTGLGVAALLAFLPRR
jgi:hypothetical protein